MQSPPGLAHTQNARCSQATTILARRKGSSAAHTRLKVGDWDMSLARTSITRSCMSWIGSLRGQLVHANNSLAQPSRALLNVLHHKPEV